MYSPTAPCWVAFDSSVMALMDIFARITSNANIGVRIFKGFIFLAGFILSLPDGKRAILTIVCQLRCCMQFGAFVSVYCIAVAVSYNGFHENFFSVIVDINFIGRLPLFRLDPSITGVVLMSISL